MDEKVVKDSQGLVKDLVNDCISRKAAIEKATKDHDFFRGATTQTDKARRDELLNVICWLGELPSAQPEKRTEERTESHACDLIDRAEAIDALRTHERKPSKKWFDNQLDIEWNNAIDICCYDIEDLPSAQPERKRGKWEITNLGAVGVFDSCSECKRVVKHKAPFYNYCPNCGADMREDDHETD